jgi:beta-glucosidase
MIANTIAKDPAFKSVLPSTFHHGYASASYQIEGGYTQDGRGLSIWDEYLKDTENGNEAVDSYNRWREDVELLKGYGSNAYRFSVSWSRVKPLGGKDDPVNEKGIEYYNKLVSTALIHCNQAYPLHNKQIDALLEAGITPWITIYHWDLPLELQDRYNGFATEDSSRIVEDFVSYAGLLFERFGDRVKNWITLNEVSPATRLVYKVVLIADSIADGLYRTIIARSRT